MSNGVNFRTLCIDLRGQLDRVTSERDAALASLDSADASAQTLHEVITRLQQRLTEADERADALEAALRTIMGSHRFNVAGMSVTEIHALCFDALASKAALKPAECGDDESEQRRQDDESLQRRDDDDRRECFSDDD